VLVEPFTETVVAPQLRVERAPEREDQGGCSCPPREARQRRTRRRAMTVSLLGMPSI
jgi:hypothetical protein